MATFLTTMVITPRASYAQEGVLGLPQPGTMVNLSSSYVPLMLTGLRVHPDNPLLIDFIVSTGNSGLNADQVKKESDRLIKYFLACLTIPEDDQWVNLSPYEKQRIVPEDLGQTVLGQDMLAQDYLLKQLTASLIYPEKNLGKNFWDKVYSKANQMYGTTQIPVNTFNKVWILPDTAKVYEHKDTALVTKSHLKVMLDEDYLALSKHQGQPGDMFNQEQQKNVSPSTNTLASQIVRQIILPAIEQEVNTGKNFAQLRQIYNSMILAVWFKNNLKQAFLNQVYTGKAKVNGVNVDDPAIKEKIYKQYLQAYKKGVFNYIKEEPAEASLRGAEGDAAISKGTTIARKYFSGGLATVHRVDPASLAEEEATLRGAPVESNTFDLAVLTQSATAGNRFDTAMTVEDWVDLANKTYGSTLSRIGDIAYQLIFVQGNPGEQGVVLESNTPATGDPKIHHLQIALPEDVNGQSLNEGVARILTQMTGADEAMTTNAKNLTSEDVINAIEKLRGVVGFRKSFIDANTDAKFREVLNPPKPLDSGVGISFNIYSHLVLPSQLLEGKTVDVGKINRDNFQKLEDFLSDLNSFLTKQFPGKNIKIDSKFNPDGSSDSTVVLTDKAMKTELTKPMSYKDFWSTVLAPFHYPTGKKLSEMSPAEESILANNPSTWSLGRENVIVNLEFNTRFGSLLYKDRNLFGEEFTTGLKAIRKMKNADVSQYFIDYLANHLEGLSMSSFLIEIGQKVSPDLKLAIGQVINNWQDGFIIARKKIYSEYKNSFDETKAVGEKDLAMRAKGFPVPVIPRAPGGIDLNSRNLKMESEGQKVNITFDAAMIAQFRRGDFSGVKIQILDVTPINLMPLLGLKEDEESGQLAKV
jgi:hypothetical protein